MNKHYSERLSELEFAKVWYEMPEPGDSVDPFEFTQRMAA